MSVVNKKVKFKFFNHINSIVLQLTLLYTLSAFIILLFSSVFLYNVLVNDLYSMDVSLIKNEISLIKKVLSSHQPQVITLDAQASTPKKVYYIRVMDKDGNTLLETPDMSLEFNRSDFPVPGENEASKMVQNIDGYYYMLGSDTLTVDDPATKTYQIEVAVNTDHHHVLIEKYRWRLAIILSIGIIISALLGALIAKRGLKPIQRMTETVGKISISQLHARMDPKDWPKELIDLVAAFNHMLARLERSFNQLKQFSADLAHELRTPIHHLVVETEISLSRGRTLEEYRETLVSNLEEYASLTSLIDRLLFLARAENPQTAVNYININLAEELAAIIEFHEAVAEEKHITMTLNCPEITLAVDNVLFQRAVNNLLSNAVKYSRPNDSITIDVTQDEKKVYIAIKDSGPGISEEHLPHLFDRFYRVDFARTKKEGGHGLGLAIVKSIMELHQGQVTVSSIVGDGTLFTLTFPKFSTKMHGA